MFLQMTWKIFNCFRTSVIKNPIKAFNCYRTLKNLFKIKSLYTNVYILIVSGYISH